MTGSSLSSLPDCPTTLAFVDAGVANPDSLISQFQPGTEVHLLNASDNAIDQITAILAGRSGVTSLHIVSHGSDGALQMEGQTFLTLTITTPADPVVEGADSRCRYSALRL